MRIAVNAELMSQGKPNQPNAHNAGRKQEHGIDQQWQRVQTNPQHSSSST